MQKLQHLEHLSMDFSGCLNLLDVRPLRELKLMTSLHLGHLPLGKLPEGMAGPREGQRFEATLQGRPCFGQSQG